MAKRKYKVVGRRPYWGVALVNGGLEYDLLDSETEAETICAVLNEGKGPEWDKIADEVTKRMETKQGA